MPAVVQGLSGVPAAGDEMLAVANERKAREAASTRQERQREDGKDGGLSPVVLGCLVHR